MKQEHVIRDFWTARPVGRAYWTQAQITASQSRLVLTPFAWADLANSIQRRLPSEGLGHVPNHVTNLKPLPHHRPRAELRVQPKFDQLHNATPSEHAILPKQEFTLKI